MIRTAFIAELRVTLDAALEFGRTARGNRRIIPITGGTVEGPLLRGTILPGGADWQVVRDDGCAELDARYTIRTDDGALIYVENRGRRFGPPEILARLARGESVARGSYYFMSTPWFETAAEPYAWLTRIVALAEGERLPDAVVLQLHQVLSSA